MNGSHPTQEEIWPRAMKRYHHQPLEASAFGQVRDVDALPQGAATAEQQTVSLTCLTQSKKNISVVYYRGKQQRRCGLTPDS